VFSLAISAAIASLRPPYPHLVRMSGICSILMSRMSSEFGWAREEQGADAAAGASGRLIDGKNVQAQTAWPHHR
jgi:hypothetical protein